MKIITKEMLIDYLGGSSMGEEGQPDPIEMLLDLLNPLPEKDCCVEGHRKCILEWTREEEPNKSYSKCSNILYEDGYCKYCCEFGEEDPADRDDRLYHEEQDHIAMEKAKENK